MKTRQFDNRYLWEEKPIYLPNDEVHIWIIRWRKMPDFWRQNQQILSGREREEAQKFRLSEDRMRYVAGKITTRLLLRRYLEED